MTLIEVLENDKLETIWAGYCDCLEPKYDLWIDEKHYGIVHESILIKHCPTFFKYECEVQE